MEGAFSFRRTMLNRNAQAKIERTQERLDAGFVSKHFPEVASIVISMMYKQKGAKVVTPDPEFLYRQLCFFQGNLFERRLC